MRWKSLADCDKLKQLKTLYPADYTRVIQVMDFAWESRMIDLRNGR